MQLGYFGNVCGRETLLFLMKDGTVMYASGAQGMKTRTLTAKKLEGVDGVILLEAVNFGPAFTVIA